MIRETSKQAYLEILQDELIGKKQRLIIAAMIEGGFIEYPNGDYRSVTANELYRNYLSKSGIANANIHTRLGELRDLGIVAEKFKRKCMITGREVITWAFLSGVKPVKFTRISKKDRKEMIKEYINVMYNINANNTKIREDLKVLWRMIKEL
jgi:hypothetical protein